MNRKTEYARHKRGKKNTDDGAPFEGVGPMVPSVCVSLHVNVGGRGAALHLHGARPKWSVGSAAVIYECGY